MEMKRLSPIGNRFFHEIGDYGQLFKLYDGRLFFAVNIDRDGNVAVYEVIESDNNPEV